MGGKPGVIFFIVFLEERECVEKLERTKNGLVFTFHFLHATLAFQAGTDENVSLS